MGKLKWQWNKVNSGHLIEFIYNGSLRVVIVLLSPKDSGAQDKTLVHGLEIVKKGNGIEGLKFRKGPADQFTVINFINDCVNEVTRKY